MPANRLEPRDGTEIGAAPAPVAVAADESVMPFVLDPVLYDIFRNEADAHLTRRLGDGVEHRVVAPGHEVVVVGGGRAAGAGQLAEAAPGRGVDLLDRQPPPHGVELDQPVEEVPPDGPAPGGPLVEVVVGVDQPGGDDVALAAEHLVAGLGGDGADGLDATVAQGDVARMPSPAQNQPAHGRGATISA